MELKYKLIRYRLMERHRELVRGSKQDMEVANRILHLLNKGEIRLGLGDVDWRAEQEIDAAGVHIQYSRSGYSAYARIRRPEKVACDCCTDRGHCPEYVPGAPCVKDREEGKQHGNV